VEEVHNQDKYTEFSFFDIHDKFQKQDINFLLVELGVVSSYQKKKEDPTHHTTSFLSFYLCVCSWWGVPFTGLDLLSIHALSGVHVFLSLLVRVLSFSPCLDLFLSGLGQSGLRLG
jgi:hypothetical protein